MKTIFAKQFFMPLFALLLSLNVTMLNAQTVSHFEITNNCSDHSFFNLWIYLNVTNSSQCFGLGNINYTWYGNTYNTALTGSGTNFCSKSASFLSSFCSGGNPTLTFPSTIVINSPAALAGTYNVDASGALLPVELVSFTAKEENQTIQLNWQTASEEINAGFEVQRSINGEEWEVLDFVEGNGTTLEVQNYTYTDEAPFAGNNYYRLKQIDFDGKFEYTHLVSVKYGKSDKAENLRIFPNPVTDRLNIVDGQGQATIYNMLGQPVKQFTVSNETSSIDVVDLPKGQYILRIQQQNGNMVTKQFVK